MVLQLYYFAYPLPFFRNIALSYLAKQAGGTVFYKPIKFKYIIQKSQPIATNTRTNLKFDK
jgi:hypothetical protein